MRMLVLGAGLQGSACAYDLLQRPEVERVTLADLHPERVPAFLKKKKSKRLVTTRLDAKKAGALRKLMRRHDAVMNALPYYFNYPVAKAAVTSGLHCADLGGNTEIVQKQKTLHKAAQRKRVSVIPDCGLAPGMVNIIAAEGIRRVGEAESVKIFVGGLPQKPEPPLNYQIVYSLEGALDYYTTPSWVLREGRPERVDALSELEDVPFPSPVGTLEAFHTGGGISTMPWAYSGKVRTMEYKTLRYPGHAAIMRPIREMGLLSLDPVRVRGTNDRAAGCVHRRGIAPAHQARRPRSRGAPRGSAGEERLARGLAAARLLRRCDRHQRDDARHRLFARDHRRDAGGWTD